MNERAKNLRAEILRLNRLLKIERDELCTIQAHCEHDFGISEDEWDSLSAYWDVAKEESKDDEQNPRNKLI